MAATKPDTLPNGTHTVTVKSVYSGTSRKRRPQLTLVLTDDSGRVARRYCPLSGDVTRTNDDMRVLGWSGDLSKPEERRRFLRERSVIGKRCKVEIQPFGDGSSSGVAALWGENEDGPWEREANDLEKAIAMAEQADADDADAEEPQADDDDQGFDEIEGQEPRA